MIAVSIEPCSKNGRNSRRPYSVSHEATGIVVPSRM